MGDIAKKCKSTHPHKTSFFYFSPKDPVRFVNCPVVLYKFALAMVGWEKGKAVYNLIDETPVPERLTGSYEEKYSAMLGLGENMVNECCEQCKAKYTLITRRTFEITDREEYLSEIAQLKKEIAQAGFHRKLDTIFPHPALLKPYDEQYQEAIEDIKNYAMEHFLGDSFVFAMEHWDDMEEDFVLYVYGKNEGNNEDVAFLMSLLTT